MLSLNVTNIKYIHYVCSSHSCLLTPHQNNTKLSIELPYFLYSAPSLFRSFTLPQLSDKPLPHVLNIGLIDQSF